MKNKLGATFVFSSLITLSAFAQQISSFDAQKGIRPPPRQQRVRCLAAAAVARAAGVRKRGPSGGATAARSSVAGSA